MTAKDIKKIIRSHYSVGRRIILYPDRYEFRWKIGDCTSIILPYPLDLSRELKINEILK